MATVDAVATGYEACRDGAGLVDRSEAGKLLLTGEQAREFLDGQVSNAVVALAPGTGVYATLLTNKGRMLGDLRALAVDDDGSLLLVTERVALQALFDQVRRGLIGWKAALHKRTLELGLLSLVGPRAEETARAAGLPVPGPDEHDVVALPATGAVATTAPLAPLGATDPAPIAGVVVRTDAGLDVLAPAGDVAAVRAALLAAGAVEASEAAAEIVRVESGRPRYGVDLDETVMPEEAGIVDRAVSFKKGCYVGQETVARLHWKGKPNRHLRGLRLSAPVAPGTPILAGDREVGRVTSAVASPRVGPIALAILRREIAPGDHVAIGAVDAEVVSPPFT
ncbi:Aminomethyltransferase [Baekduia alba]|uniref:CAF17-like 4Fe-4S cluster assembly/insertion protein YgfZ n=1 Tax=Baekduia alba TaxID=2997333 RepID=UPI002340C48A|nr:glycine cleavage T C-terminal barrel domain-containing protein [Baekduia alba]WCB93228.1 Aminomethyltransferase [Baekduia alba]